jgi:hypothetical protein
VADDDILSGGAEAEPATQPPGIADLEPDIGAERGPEQEPELAPDGQLGGLAVVPAFQAGGRVERTGIALVHEGEYVVPAADSEAVISPVGGGTNGQPVTWSFPIEVEVVGQLSEEHLQAVARHVFDELDTALRGVG